MRKPDSFGDLDLVEDVAAADSGEMWALIRDGRGYGELRVVRRDGSRWALLPSPSPLLSLPQRGAGWCANPSQPALHLEKLTARTRNEVWALGSVAPCGGGPSVRKVVLHWNGTSWQEANPPSAAIPLCSDQATTGMQVLERRTWRGRFTAARIP
ncbi:hypothetical protein [Nonomuraea basaltis]|uniref:hypothetical protein n=1 Tax=Nonomuraea basaltis TaxID=2495887 RepID=UPI00110C469B|nr:hypothetical protein [Nonomuraea basaltis]TMR87889.1 hypothetical protein EJK15_69305 [Nonomuraea basaltis]